MDPARPTYDELPAVPGLDLRHAWDVYGRDDVLGSMNLNEAGSRVNWITLTLVSNGRAAMWLIQCAVGERVTAVPASRQRHPLVEGSKSLCLRKKLLKPNRMSGFSALSVPLPPALIPKAQIPDSYSRFVPPLAI